MANKITLQEFITKWGFEVNDKELEKLDAKFAQTRETLEKLEDKITSAGQKLSAFLTVPLVAAGGASVKFAADALDTQERFEKVFNQLGQGAVNLANNFASSFGLSNSAAQTLLVTNGQLLKNFGFSQEQALRYGEQIGALSADLAEFNQIEGGAEEVSGILRAALAGQTRGLKALGITIDEDTIKKQVQQDAANGVRFATLKQAEAFATLQLIQKKSQDASGAFANSQDDLGVVLQRIRARLANVAVAFGKILLPPVIKVLKFIERGVKFFEGLSDNGKTLILVFAGIAAAIGPILLLIGVAIKLFTIWQTAVVLFGNASLIASAKALAIPLLIGAALVALGLIIEDIVGFFQGRDSVTGVIVEKFKEAFVFLQDGFQAFGDRTKAIIVGLLLPFNALINLIKGVGGALGALSVGDFSGALGALKESGQKFIDPISSLVTGQGANLGLSEAAGFGRPSIQSPPSRSNNIVSQNVNAPVTVNVPEGTSPEAVGPFVQKGISEGMSSVLRQTQRQTRSAVIN